MLSEHKVMIGLEVHAQLTSLKSKLFCSCSADYRNLPPNTSVCETCLGLPGSLPHLNGKAIEEVLKIALALHSKPSENTLFYRKHYFYPDMAKNFQISQYDRGGGVTIASGGWMQLSVGNLIKNVRVRRVQLEEDVAKIVYPSSLLQSEYVLVDYNRAGVALCEMVTEPDMTSPKEARLFIEKYATILQHLGVTDTSLEGSLRVDANISIDGGDRVELKNINSPKDVEKALNYEVQRQIMLVEKGSKIRMETRHWDEMNKITVAPRFKEEEEDYRYFPESDLPPLRINPDLVKKLEETLPELPDQRVERLVKQYQLTEYQASVLVSEKRLADSYEEAVKKGLNPSQAADWFINEVLGDLAEAKKDISELPKMVDSAVNVIMQVQVGAITGKIGKRLMKQLILNGSLPSETPKPITDEKTLYDLVREVISENPEVFDKARSDPKAVNYLVGQVMKKTRGTAEPKKIVEMINGELRKNN